MTPASRQKLLGGGLAVLAGVVAMLAVTAFVGSEPGIAWRYRGHFDALLAHCFSAHRSRDPVTPAHYAALRRLAVEQAAADDPEGRAAACTAWVQLADEGIGATPAEVRAQKAALIPLLRDRRGCSRSTFRICDLALFAGGRPGCFSEDRALTDRNAEQLRGELERELAGP